MWQPPRRGKRGECAATFWLPSCCEKQEQSRCLLAAVLCRCRSASGSGEHAAAGRECDTGVGSWVRQGGQDPRGVMSRSSYPGAGRFPPSCLGVIQVVQVKCVVQVECFGGVFSFTLQLSPLCKFETLQ